MEHNTSPLITILTPAYNAEQHICRCLDSLTVQTYTHIEIIVIDDCSTDSTPLILTDYAQRDKRIRILRTEKNSGAAAARNKGLQIAAGEYISEVDADDRLAPDAIEKAVGVAMANAETDYVLYDTVLVNERTATESPYPVEQGTKSVMSGAEACFRSIGWGIHGWGLCRATLYRQYPCQTNIGLYGDENSTHLQLLHAREVRLSEGRHFYHVNDSSATHVINVRRFDILEGRLALRHQLIAAGAEQRIVIRQNHVRWIDFIGACYLYWKHKKSFSSEERGNIWQRLTDAYATFCFADLPITVTLKPRYVMMPTFRLFYFQILQTFLIRELVGKFLV